MSARFPRLLPLLALSVLVLGCATTGRSGSTAAGLPRMPIPDDVRAEVDDALHGRVPSRVLGDITSREVASADTAVEELVNQFPEYDQVVECWTEARDHYVLSVRLGQAPDHAYRFVVFVPVGGRMFRVYLASR